MTQPPKGHVPPHHAAVGSPAASDAGPRGEPPRLQAYLTLAFGLLAVLVSALLVVSVSFWLNIVTGLLAVPVAIVAVLLAVTAIIIGHLTLPAVKRGTQGGRGIALAGLIGAHLTIAGIVIPSLIWAAGYVVFAVDLMS